MWITGPGQKLLYGSKAGYLSTSLEFLRFFGTLENLRTFTSLPTGLHTKHEVKFERVHRPPAARPLLPGTLLAASHKYIHSQ